jgi:hypothetical protein
MSESTQQNDNYLSINADRTAPYSDPDVERQNAATYGANEDVMADRDTEIAPTFSDMEPGAGPNYGAAGDPSAPNLGGLEDRTTLGDEDVRPADTQMTTGAESQSAAKPPPHPEVYSYGRSPENGLGGAHPLDAAQSDDASGSPGAMPRAADQQRADNSRQSVRADATPGRSGPGSSGDPGDSGPGMLNQERGEHKVGAGPADGTPSLGGTPDTVVAGNTYRTHALGAPGVSTTGANTIDDKNEAYPGLAGGDKVTYGHPEVYQGDHDVGRFGSSSGGAGDLAGGHINDLFDREPARDALTPPGVSGGATDRAPSDDKDLNP